MKCATIALAIASAYGLEDIGLTPAEQKVALAAWETAVAAPKTNLTLGSCSKDMRSKLPSCLQYQSEWCWATAVSEIWGFFDSSVHQKEQGGDCHGQECKIAGHILGEDCCDETRNRRCDSAGSGQNIVNAIQWATGQRYTQQNSLLSEEKLMSVLSNGAPVAIGVLWSTGGGHILTIAGCDGNGNYYVHDPAAGDGGKSHHYQTLRYDDFVTYHPPASPRGHGKWSLTVFKDTSKSKEVEFVQGGTLKLDWKDCGDSTYHAKVTDVEPKDLDLGKKTSVVGAGTTDEQVTGGGFTIDAKFGPVTENWSGDVCTAKTFTLPLGLGKVTWDGINCPAAVGKVSVGVDVSLSRFIPASAASGTIAIKATDAKKGNLICLTLDISKAVSDNIVV